MKTKNKLTHKKMLQILKEARHTPDIDLIKLNTDDFYDLVEEKKFESVLDLINNRPTQKLGLHAHLYGFGIYCSLNIDNGKFALGKIVGNIIEHQHIDSVNLEWLEPKNI